MSDHARRVMRRMLNENALNENRFFKAVKIKGTDEETGHEEVTQFGPRFPDLDSAVEYAQSVAKEHNLGPDDLFISEYVQGESWPGVTDEMEWAGSIGVGTRADVPIKGDDEAFIARATDIDRDRGLIRAVADYDLLGDKTWEDPEWIEAKRKREVPFESRRNER